MNVLETARGFLKALGYQVQEKERNLFIAEKAGLGGDTDRACVWVLTQDLRQGRNPLLVEEEYLNRFKGIATKYPGARLYLVVETMEGFSADFRSRASRSYGVRIQVPAQLFDIPFSWEEASGSASATRQLMTLADTNERFRVPQAYHSDGNDIVKSDLVADLLAEIQATIRTPDPRLWLVVAPAGHGKSVFFSALFARLYQHFHDRKRAQALFPRPLPLLAEHLRESAGPNVMGLIDAFMRTEFSALRSREYFNWLIDNRLALPMFDGLDEVITRDPTFIDYIENRITAPNSSPAFLICLRDSLLESNEDLANFLDYYRSAIRMFTLIPWDATARRTHAWTALRGRLPRNGEPDPPDVAAFLRTTNANPAIQHLAATPFYADLLVRVFANAQGASPGDEVTLVELAVTEMCRREYGKGTLTEDVLPLASFEEWLEELATLGYQSTGFSAAELRELADLITILSPRNLDEDEQRALIDQITMGPFITRSPTSGRLQLTHEILTEFLAGKRFAHEFVRDTARFASRLCHTPWPSDSILFLVLAGALRDRLDLLAQLPTREPLSPEGLRNFIQLLALIPGADARFRDGTISVEGARLNGVRFRGLNLTGVSFRGCDLEAATFDRCTLHGNRFEGAHFRNTFFTYGTESGLKSGSFSDCEHFESVVLGERSRFDDPRAFMEWILGAGARKDTPVGPCPAARQVLVLFRKYIHVDGQPRRDSHGRRSLLRGRQEHGGPSAEACLSAAIDLGYLEEREFDQIRRPTGPKYGEMVSYVKSQVLSPGLRSLLDSLCRVPGCSHVSRRGD